ncbi:MAG: hypothetical protein ABSF00_00065 [Candidatus Bathyarchaeia archaeon]
MKESSAKSRHCIIAINFLPPARSTAAHPHIPAFANDILSAAELRVVGL